MVATCFMYMLLFAGMALVLGVLGGLGTLAFHGEAATRDFIGAYFGTFNAIGVASTGFALMVFVRRTGRTVISQLTTNLCIPDKHQAQFARELNRTTSWRTTNYISIPLMIIGSIALWWRGFPLEGFPFARWYLAICAFSIYYVASNILSFYLFVILLFRFIEERSSEGPDDRFRLNVSPGGLELRNIDNFLIVSATLGVFTLYVGIRATLTATFIDSVPFLRELLLLPFILYLPATLCYSFYPRYVLRHLSECDTLAAIDQFERQIATVSTGDVKATLELRKLIMDVKEKMMNDCRAAPILGLKDAPSLTMSLIILIQVVVQKDSVYAGFIKSLFP